MTGDPPPRAPFRPGDWAAILGIFLGLGGLIWTAAAQSTKIDDSNNRIAAVEKTQTTDHDSITDMRADLRFLVERERRRDEGGK